MNEPFQRLIAQNQLVTYRNPGFWACMDTFKEKRMFDDLVARGDMPWAVWEQPANQVLRPLRVYNERIMHLAYGTEAPLLRA